MMKYIKTIIFFLFVYGQTVSQTCEKYNRKLFHSLPDTFPNLINCKDKSDKKQGWWMYYKVEYNPVDRPDELAKGDYVDEYTYGQYKNDIKVGTWTYVKNVHLIYEYREDKYYYSKDTSRMTSWHGPTKSDVLYTKDSTIIKSITSDKDYLVCIECDKKKDEMCIMTYNKKHVKKFPISDFTTEFEKTLFIYWFLKDNIEEKQK